MTAKQYLKNRTNLHENLLSPSRAATLTGDFKKAIDYHGTPDTRDDTFVMDGDNYARDGDEANTLDLISGTAGDDVIDGGGGDDALSGMAGDDRISGFCDAPNDDTYNLYRRAA